MIFHSIHQRCLQRVAPGRETWSGGVAPPPLLTSTVESAGLLLRSDAAGERASDAAINTRLRYLSPWSSSGAAVGSRRSRPGDPTTPLRLDAERGGAAETAKCGRPISPGCRNSKSLPNDFPSQCRPRRFDHIIPSARNSRQVDGFLSPPAPDETRIRDAVPSSPVRHARRVCRVRRPFPAEADTLFQL
jgi:hypothetical protein